MSKGFLIFLLLIPIIAAVGHDAYFYYINQDEGIKLTELGWLWTAYHQESHDALYEKLGPELWKQYFIPILSLKSVVAAAIFGGIILLLILIVRSLSSIGKNKFSPKSNQRNLGRERGAAHKAKYKRR